MFDEKEQLFRQLFRIQELFRKNIILVLTVITGFVLLGILLSQMLVTPLYYATAKVYIRPYSNDGNIYAEDMEISRKIAGDCVEIMQSEEVLSRAIVEAGMTQTMDAASLQEQMYAALGYQSRMIELTVVGQTRESAELLADKICEETVKSVDNILGRNWCAVADRSYAEKEPYYPRQASVIGMSVIFGIVFLFLMAVILTCLDNKIKEKDEIKVILGMDVLGVIPRNKQ